MRIGSSTGGEFEDEALTPFVTPFAGSGRIDGCDLARLFVEYRMNQACEAQHVLSCDTPHMAD